MFFVLKRLKINFAEMAGYGKININEVNKRRQPKQASKF